MVEVKWLGQAAFEIETAEKTLLIDPWLEGNTKACKKVEDLKKVDVICVTHDHDDHLGDAVKILNGLELRLLAYMSYVFMQKNKA